MEKSLRDHLVGALDELVKDNLKRFRNKLNDCKVKEGFEKIPRGRLQDKDPEDIADLIIQYYGDSYGPELTLTILRAINENKVAADLQKLLDKDPKKHFVDEHQVALIEGVALVAPILDRLMSADLLTYEEYDTIWKEPTSYAQMRKLYVTKVKSWKDPQKDKFKNVLRETDRVLVTGLEKP